MRKLLCLFAGLLLAGAILGQSSGKISPRLQALMADQPISLNVIAVLKDQVDVFSLNQSFNQRGLNQLERINELLPALTAKASHSQTSVTDWLNRNRNISSDALRSLWIVNAIVLEASVEDIRAIAERNDIREIIWDAPVYVEEHSCESPELAPPMSPGDSERGLNVIKAAPLWAMGYTGYGAIAMTADEGVDPFHPAYSNRWMGSYVPQNQSWFQPNSSNTLPSNCGDHGSHTLGTIVGVEHFTNDTVGVAPQANWIGASNLCVGGNSTSRNIATFQWALNPDNNLQTITDMPTVVNNSWWDPGQIEGAECSSAYVNTLTSMESAGIAVIFSAGNEGPNPSTVTPPKNINTTLVNAFCVGNLNGNSSSFPIAESSSRGPSICGSTGAMLIKPEVSAPGSNVRSCTLDRGYGNKSGTSMAAPHVAGAILLLKEAFPEILSEEFKFALYHSAIDLGVAGEDNTFGNGLIDVTAAFDYLVGIGHIPATPVSTDLDLIGADSDAQRDYCNGDMEMTFYVTNGGDPVIGSFDYTLDITRNNGTNVYTTSGNWTGALANADVASIDETINGLSPGTYFLNFKTSNPNNSVDPRPLNNAVAKILTIRNETGINYTINSAVDGEFCAGSRVLLSADLDVNDKHRIRWYGDFVGKEFLGEGPEWLSPVITQPTDVFVKAEIDITAGPDAPTEGIYTAGNLLRINLLTDVTLRSMDIVAENPGNLIVRVLDSDGEIIKVTSFNIPSAGVHTVYPDFDLESGAYSIGILGSTKLLEKTTDFQFPYQGGGELLILGSVEGNSTYAYFYNVTVTRNYDCAPRRIQLIPAEESTFSMEIELASDTVELFTNFDVTINNTEVTTANWSFGDGNTSDDLMAVHQYHTPGFYKISVVATNALGCSNARQKTIYAQSTTSVNTDYLDANIRLFPNPTNGLLTIETIGFEPSSDFQIYDLNGRQVLTVAKRNSPNASYSVDLTHLPSGVYWVKIYSEKTGNYARKVIVQK